MRDFDPVEESPGYQAWNANEEPDEDDYEEYQSIMEQDNE